LYMAGLHDANRKVNITMTSTRDIYQEEDTIYYSDGYSAHEDNFGDKPSRPTNTTSRRSLSNADDETTYSPIQRRSSRTSEDTSDYTRRIPAEQRRTGDVDPRRGPRRQPEPGPKFVRHDLDGNVLDEYGNVVRSRRPQPQLQRRQVQTTQPRVQRVQPQPVTTGPVMRRRAALKMVVGGIVLGSFVGLADLPNLEQQQNTYQNHYKQGDIPNDTISAVVGHNNDSALHPTILDFRVNGDQLVFQETPASDQNKTHGIPMKTMQQLGYTGHIADLFLSINLTPSGNKFSVELTVTWYERSWWLFFQPKTSSAILVDLGHGYFEAPPSK
jgi:hypothetical protein